MYPEGQPYTYSANDMSIGDVDGDGELEYIVKWDPSNAHDVSHRGYTGNATLTAIDWTAHFYGVLIWDQISAQERTIRNLWCTILTVTERQKCA